MPFQLVVDDRVTEDVEHNSADDLTDGDGEVVCLLMIAPETGAVELNMQVVMTISEHELNTTSDTTSNNLGHALLDDAERPLEDNGDVIQPNKHVIANEHHEFEDGMTVASMSFDGVESGQWVSSMAESDQWERSSARSSLELEDGEDGEAVVAVVSPATMPTCASDAYEANVAETVGEYTMRYTMLVHLYISTLLHLCTMVGLFPFGGDGRRSN